MLLGGIRGRRAPVGVLGGTLERPGTGRHRRGFGLLPDAAGRIRASGETPQDERAPCSPGNSFPPPRPIGCRARPGTRGAGGGSLGDAPRAAPADLRASGALGRARDRGRDDRDLRGRGLAPLRDLRRRQVPAREPDGGRRPDLGGRPLGLHDPPCVELAPADVALPHARLRALRPVARPPPLDERRAARGERRAAPRGAPQAGALTGRRRLRRGVLRPAPVARRVGRLGLGAQGRPERALLDARPPRLRLLGGARRSPALRRGLRVARPRPARQADARELPPRPPARRPVAPREARPRAPLAARPGEAPSLRARRRCGAGHDVGAGGRDERRRPPTGCRPALERLRRRRRLLPADPLAGRARLLLSPSGDRAGRLHAVVSVRAGLHGGPRRRERRRDRAAQAGPVPARRLVLDARDAPARGRARPGRGAGARRPLHLPADDRGRPGRELRRRRSRAGSARSPCHLGRGHRRALPLRLGGARPGRDLAQHAHALRARRERYRAQLRRPHAPRHPRGPRGEPRGRGGAAADRARPDRGRRGPPGLERVRG